MHICLRREVALLVVQLWSTASLKQPQTRAYTDCALRQATALRRETREVDLAQSAKQLKVWALSDLHTDHATNLDWLQQWQSRRGAAGVHHVLLVAGDVSSQMLRFEATLLALVSKFDDVVLVAGNHDLWAQKRLSPDTPYPCSIQKLIDVTEVCAVHSVTTDPLRVRGRGFDVLIMPLLSWYHASFDREPDLPPESQHRNGDFTRRWGDYVRCRWPAELITSEVFTDPKSKSTALADFFASLNDQPLAAVRHELETGADRPFILSMSHFLSRQELCPTKVFLTEPNLPKVIGSDALERQIRQLGSDMHVFGHTHIPIDMKIDGLRYLQYPLGSPAEQTRQCSTMRRNGPLLVYDSTNGDVANTCTRTWWGSFYETHARDPSQTEVPEWAKRRVNHKLRREQRAIMSEDSAGTDS